MKKIIALQTAALLMIVAAATAQVLDSWGTIDTWQYTAKASAVACSASANSTGTLFVGGRAGNDARDSAKQLGVVKVYQPSEIAGETGGRVLFASPGNVGSVAAGTSGDVYFTGEFPDASGAYRWTVLHCTAGGTATRYVQTDGAGGGDIALYDGKVYVVGSCLPNYDRALRVFAVGETPSSLTLLTDVRLFTPDGRKMYTRGIVVNADGIFVAGAVPDRADYRFSNWLIARSTDHGVNWEIIDTEDVPSYGANALTLDDQGTIYAGGRGPGYTWQVRMYPRIAEGIYGREDLETYLLQPALDAAAVGIGICGGELYVAGWARDYDPVAPTKKSPGGTHNTWITRKASVANPYQWNGSDFYWPPSAYPGGTSWVNDLAVTADRVFVVGYATEFYPKAPRSPMQADRWVVRAFPAP